MTDEEYKKFLEDISNSNHIIGDVFKFIVPILLGIWILTIIAGIIWLIVNF